jgi:cyclopropane fatty-acyl-phospholipid synthase-like methyltransferase
VTAYDRIAERWAADRRNGFRERPYIERFAELAVPGGRVLDLGCGAGYPIASFLLERGFRVTGVDESREQLRLARANCPRAELIHSSLLDLEPDGTFEGAVAWDSVFHIPRAHHAELFAGIARWLAPGAPLLLSLGASESEFTDTMYSFEFFYSAHSPEASRALLEDAGFDLLVCEIDDPSSRGHLALLAQRQ